MRVIYLAVATLLIGCEGVDPPEEAQPLQIDQQANGAQPPSPSSPEVPSDDFTINVAIDAQFVESFLERQRQQHRFTWNGFAAPADALADRLRELNPGFLDEPAQSRTWMNCDGYMANNASLGFCEETVPNDWIQFEFADDIYYFVPLSS